MPMTAKKIEIELPLDDLDTDPASVARRDRDRRAIAAGIRPPTGRRVRRPRPVIQRGPVMAFLARTLGRLIPKGM